MSCKYKYNNQWYTKEEIFSLLLKERNISSKGELIKPETSTNYKWLVFSEMSDEGDTAFKDLYRGFIAEFDTKEEADIFAESQYPSDLHYVKRGNSKGIPPKITNENLKESITEVEHKMTFNPEVKEYIVKQGNSFYEYSDTKEGALLLAQQDDWFDINEPYTIEENITQKKEHRIEKEYISQAEINLKVAALKEGVRKYPRSLIRSEVKFTGNTFFSNDELPFQKIPSVNIQDSQGNQYTVQESDIITYSTDFGDLNYIKNSEGELVMVNRNIQENFVSLQEIPLNLLQNTEDMYTFTKECF